MARKKGKSRKSSSRLRLKIMLVALFPMILMAVIVGVVAARNMSEGMRQEMLYALKAEAHSLEQVYNAVNSDTYSVSGNKLMKGSFNITDETGRYLPFGYRNGAPSPYQKDKRADIAKLNRIRLHLDDLVTRMGEQLYGGQIAAEPLVVSTNRSPCAWCDYDFICCHETGIGERGLEAPAKPFEPEAAEDEEEPT